MNDKQFTQIKALIDKYKDNGGHYPNLLITSKCSLLNDYPYFGKVGQMFGVDCYVTNTLNEDTDAIVISSADLERLKK